MARIQHHVIVEKCHRLLRLMDDDMQVPVTLLRLGFLKLGLHRRDEYDLSLYQKNLEFQRRLSQEAWPDTVQPNEVYSKYGQLFEDFIHAVNWTRACDELQQNSTDLIDAIVEVLDEAKQIEGYQASDWCASIFGLTRPDVVPVLNGMLLKSHFKPGPLFRLGEVRRRPCWNTHVELIKQILVAHFITDVTSYETKRRGFVSAFTSEIEALRDELGATPLSGSCRNARPLGMQNSERDD
jgi:hypothetical protein